MMGLVVEAEDGGTDVLGKYVSELQDSVKVGDTHIIGNLHYVTDYTGFSSNPAQQEGNFIALKFAHPDGASTTVEIVGGYSGPVELDSDMNWVGKIANNDQKIKVVTTLSDQSKITNIYDLSMLDLESAPADED